MKICITRNAEARTNASMARVADALLSTENEICLLTRSRYCDDKTKIVESKYKYNKVNIPNYEIQLKAQTGRGMKNIFQLIHFQFLLVKWLLTNSDKYDIIHSFDLDTGLPVFLVSKLKKKKYVYHIADFYVDSRRGIPKILKKVVRKLEYMVISNAETTIICTEERKHQIQGSNPKNLVVIHNTPSKSLSISSKQNKEFDTSNPNKENLTFTYVGLLSDSRFIKSVIDVFKEQPEFKLELAGMGNMSDYAKQASKEYNNINYYGMIDYEDAFKLYSKCDVMFAIYDPDIPNHKYSAPNKVYEAMMLGKPIIVAKGTGVDKLVEKENIGICIDYSEDNFKTALNYIIKNPKDIKEMGNRAKDAYDLYSWDKMKERLIKLYSEIKRNN